MVATELLDRTRTALAGTARAREVRMFGGIAFMVNDRMVVSVNPSRLLIRADPARAHELVAIEGAEPAEMGGRPMQGGWISVDEPSVATRDALEFWIAVALEFNQRTNA